MSTLLFSNNATTTIAGSISNVATAVNLSPGSGALFPALSAGQVFIGTFVDAATGLLREIVQVTARSGDTLTIVRAQEGTTALGWTAGDIFANLWTAGQAASMAQGSPQLQKQVFTASGTFTAPAGTTAQTVYKITAVGPGGRGGNSNGASVVGGGGGGGGAAIFWGSGITAGATCAVVLNSSLSSLNFAGTVVTGNSGNAGQDDGSTNAGGGPGGTAVNGTLNMGGQAGGSPTGGASGGPGGSSFMGGGGASANAAAGAAGNNYGGGGAGGGNGTNSGGAGAPGIVIVEWMQ